MRAAASGLNRRCNLGRAYPRQPASSPSGPPSRLGPKSVSICTNSSHCQRSKPDFVMKKAARKGAASTIDTPDAAPSRKLGRVVQIRTALQLRVKIQCVASAASVGPNVPMEREKRERLLPSSMGSQRMRLNPYASTKYSANWLGFQSGDFSLVSARSLIQRIIPDHLPPRH